MAVIVTNAKAKYSSVSAVVTRADGRVEDHGLIAFSHRNPIINFVVNLYIRIKEIIHDRPRPK